jgi:hypothetical protein
MALAVHAMSSEKRKATFLLLAILGGAPLASTGGRANKKIFPDGQADSVACIK